MKVRQFFSIVLVGLFVILTVCDKDDNNPAGPEPEQFQSLSSPYFKESILISVLFGVFGCSALWSIRELFQQEARVGKGWFPANPKRGKEKDKEQK